MLILSFFFFLLALSNLANRLLWKECLPSTLLCPVVGVLKDLCSTALGSERQAVSGSVLLCCFLSSWAQADSGTSLIPVTQATGTLMPAS